MNITIRNAAVLILLLIGTSAKAQEDLLNLVDKGDSKPKKEYVKYAFK